MLFRTRYRALILPAMAGVLMMGCAGRDATVPAGSGKTSARATSPAALSSAGEFEDGVAVRGEAGRGSAGSDAAEAAVAKMRVEANAHYAAAVLHELDGDAELALAEYCEAALQDPGNEELVVEVARRLQQAGQSEKVVDLLERATAVPGAPGSLYARLAMAYARIGKTEEAVKASRAAIRKEPRLLGGYQNLVVIFLQNKRSEEALAVLQEASRVSQTDAEFLVGLSELYATVGMQEPARKKVAYDRALAVLERAEKLKVDDIPLRLRMADGFNLLGVLEKAVAMYVDLLKEMPEMPYIRDTIRAKLTDLYLRASDKTRAMEQIAAIIRDNPTDPQAYYTLGRIASEAGDHERAAENFAKTLLLNPGLERVYYDLAIAQLGMERPGDALSTIDKARGKFPQSYAMEYLSGSACSGKGDYTNALRHFTVAEVMARASDGAQLPGVLYQLGAVYERMGDDAEAERQFEKCLAVAPDHDGAMNYLGYMLAERGEKLDRARQLIEGALKAEPDNAAYLDSMAWVLFRLNRPGEAIGTILKAVKLIEATGISDGDNATIYDHLGDIQASLGEPGKALEAWKKSLSLKADDKVRAKIESGGGR